MLKKTKGKIIVALNNLSRDARKLIDEETMKVEDMIAKLPSLKPLDLQEFVKFYTKNFRRKESFEQNATKLYEWLRNQGYIISKEE